MARIASPDSTGTPVRCTWTGIADPLYARYHDEEWGVPQGDDVKLFEKLVLEGFQAGLSWLTILRKREHFRKVFHGFDAARIARFGERDIERLMGDAGIVRHRGKIEATISNARAFLALREKQGLAALLWTIAREDAKPRAPLGSMSEAQAETPTSRRMSKVLKAAGFRFVGPTTVYAFMQSTGMVNDHLASCHRHGPCAVLQKTFEPPTR
jgi:DNA-3-methyladenine glycosylase I